MSKHLSMQKNRNSLIITVFLILCIAVARILTLKPDELSWDVFGYYIHLPALFIYNDHGLNDLSWIHNIVEQYHTTGSLYQISSGPDNNPIFFFLMGMSFFYAPWFFIAHLIASLTGYPTDGFSLPYQYTIAIGALIYTTLGLIYLRKILLHFFNDTIASIVLILLVLGTNYFHFMTIKNLETANILFLMVTLVTWNTIRWHQYFKLKNLVGIAVFITLAALAKPSEILLIIVPLLWGVYNKQTLIAKWNQIITHKNQFFVAIVIVLIVALPQMLYWFNETGHFLYDSYKNPGVGLDLLSPHIIPILFSFKKGWLLYTPIMIFSLIGFYYLYKRNKSVFVPVFVYCVISFYIIASWTEWWYGASFSIRPMITLYPVLAICLGYFLMKISTGKIFTKSIISIVFALFIALNLFQTWQLWNYIIDPYRMTKNYYFAIFGKTQVNDNDRQHMAVDFFAGSSAKFPDENNFQHRNIGYYDFEEYNTGLGENIFTDSLKGKVLRMDENLAFSPEIRSTFDALTDKEYVWVKARVDMFIPEGYKEELPLLVITFDRKGGSYYYHSYGMDTIRNKPGTWGTVNAELMTSDIRSRNDRFKVYVWHRGKSPIYIDNLKVDIFEP